MGTGAMTGGAAVLLLACAALATEVPTGGAVPPEAAASQSVKLVEVQVLDRRSRKLLPGLPVEVTSSVPIPCLRAPCPPSEQRRWQGITDERGVLAYPASLEAEGAVVYARAMGSDFAVDVRGEGGRDARKRPVLLLEPPRKP